MTDAAPTATAAASIHWDTQGQGEPILLIHAGVADSRMWEPQLAPFSASHQVLRFDWRGMGQTPLTGDPYTNYDDAIAVLDAAGVGRAHVIGISRGGTIALELALAHPNRVHSLVVGASSPPGMIEATNLLPIWEQVDALIAAGDLDGANELEVQLWVDGPIRQTADVDPAVRALVAEMNRISLATDWSIANEQPFAPPVSERLDEIAIPTLILAGEYDQPSSVAGPKLLSEQIAGAEYVELPGVAHMLNMERPEQFNGVVLDFLARHPMSPA